MYSHFKERSRIESSKPFQRLDEKTQVLMPLNGRTEIVKTRQTHSYEVATSAMIMAENIAKNLNIHYSQIDYMNAIENTCLLHDLGHPPFGHDGADMISEFFEEKGLKEGFDDNNNNLITLEKNGIVVSDHVKVSLIKYPHKLYEIQKGYLSILNKEIERDKKHFSNFGIDLKNQKRTITCQIMDEADRNSYVCSDLSDFFCLGNKITLNDIKAMSQYNSLSPEVRVLINEMLLNVSKNHKSTIRDYFNNLTNKFNEAWILTNDGLAVENHTMIEFREFLSCVEFEFFIRPIRKEKLHIDNMYMLKEFLNYVFDNEYYPSNTYASLIHSTTDEEMKLRYLRDMVSEVSDWYIVKFYQKMTEESLI